MRGLKRYDALNMPEYLGSHLLQMRGLKRLWVQLDERAVYPQVASFTDAWIETSYGRPKDTSRASHLLQMRGLKPQGAQRNLKK